MIPEWKVIFCSTSVDDISSNYIMRIVYMKISTDGGEVYLGIIFVYMKIREGGPFPRSKALSMQIYDFSSM